jgi:hypothetical protein
MLLVQKSEVVLAEAVRVACIEAAAQAYEDAGIRGLCDEGRWECALAAMRCLDLATLSTSGSQTDASSPTW